MSAPTTINQRFGQLIKELGLNKNAFAQSLGKTASVIQHLMDGRNKPGYDLLYKVFEIYPNVSRDWLMLGKGPMMLAGSTWAHEEASAASVSGSPAAGATQEALDFDEPVMPPPRRPAGGSQLQPADIAATLALAASAAPARASAPLPPDQLPAAATPALSAPLPAPVAPAAALPSALSEASLALALQTQHLQHQLALAELRNQHLLEQQQMLREMLAMAQKAV